MIGSGHEKFSLRFYWRGRPKGEAPCAKSLGEVLEKLAQVHPLFKKWHRLGNSSDEAKVPVDMAVLQRWTAEGVFRRDDDKSIMEDLGFSVALVAEKNNQLVFLKFHCGVSECDGSNSCIMDIGQSLETEGEFLQVDRLIEMASCIIDVCDPIYGVLSSNKFGSLYRMTTNFYCRAGWMTYLSPEHDRIREVPGAARIVNMGKGRLVVATEERLSTTNPEHVKVVLDLSKQMIESRKKNQSHP